MTSNWNKNNPEKHIAGVRKWQKKNPDKVRMYWVVWYERNKEVAKDRLRLWREKNKDKKTGYDRSRRARRHGSRGSHTPAQFRSLCESFGNVCVCCKQSKPLTEDHVIPLINGGTDFIENIQPLCGPCNSRKGTKSTDYRKVLSGKPEEDVKLTTTYPIVRTRNLTRRGKRKKKV